MINEFTEEYMDLQVSLCSAKEDAGLFVWIKGWFTLPKFL
jgi:hypothetical protein